MLLLALLPMLLDAWPLPPLTPPPLLLAKPALFELKPPLAPAPDAFVGLLLLPAPPPPPLLPPGPVPPLFLLNHEEMFPAVVVVMLVTDDCKTLRPSLAASEIVATLTLAPRMPAPPPPLLLLCDTPSEPIPTMRLPLGPPPLVPPLPLVLLP